MRSSNPFKSIFTQSDNDKMIDAINSFEPDVLFVGMTAPKQEEWAIKFKESLDAKIICSIGAVFDFYAGTKKRPDKIWIDMGLEWFGRFVDEPKRMWKRYLYYGPIFIWVLFKNKFKQSLTNNKNDSINEMAINKMVRNATFIENNRLDKILD